MKTVLFVVTLLLVISFSTGTAMAQCASPYPVNFPNGDGSFSCVGDGQYYDAGFGLSSNGVCIPGAGGACGQCYGAGLQLSPYGLCLHPPCANPNEWWDLYGIAWITLCNMDEYCAYQAATSEMGCDAWDWSKKLKAPKLPWKKDVPESILALYKGSPNVLPWRRSV